MTIPPKALECGNQLPLLTSQPRCDAQQPTGSAETKAQTGLRTPQPSAEQTNYFDKVFYGYLQLNGYDRDKP